MVYAADGTVFARAIGQVAPDVEVVVARHPTTDRPATLFGDLLATAPDPAVDAAHAAVGPDTIAKILFTSGSTGVPKGVINTQRMWCSNQVMLHTALAFLQDEPPVIVDWAPWHHTAGGNHDVGLVLMNGGTMYIDEGKPLPGLIETTVQKSARDRADLVLHRPEGLRGAAALFPRPMTNCAATSSAASRCFGSPAPRCRNPCSTR